MVKFAVVFLAVAGCSIFKPFPKPTSQEPIAAPALPPLHDLPQKPSATSDDGSRLFKMRLGDVGAWLYAPPSSLKPDAKLPAVLIAPAGSDLLTGMNLSDDDRPEHLPYLDAGFVVLAYELPGKDSTQTFAASNAGLDNGRAALEFLRAKVPFVDEGRIFTAGHSSAADAALLLAAHEPSLAGVTIYNSAGEGCWFQSDSLLKLYSREVNNLEQFCLRTHAASHVAHLNVPAFLFSSEADNIVPAGRVRQLAASIEARGVDLTLQVSTEGDHYQSMVSTGIPSAIDWMLKRGAL